MNKAFLRVPLQEKVLFTKSLALSLKSGVSLVKSLELLRRQAKSSSLKKILDTLIKEGESGVFLSKGLEQFKGVFGELFINIIKVAESSGTLPENLLYLGDELRKKQELRKKVRGALVYPVIILIATVVIATTMVVFVFPKILPLFQNAKDLPLTTRTLIALSDVISSYGFILLAALIAFFVGVRLALRVPAVRFVWHRFLFVVPMFGRSIINYNMTNCARTLGLLLRSGVQIVEAVNITAATLTNLVYRRSFEQAAERIRTGEFLSKYLGEKPRWFPLTFVNMVEVGENTGNLTENLVYLAEYYEGEVDDFVKNLSSILEPVLLMVMGGIVGFIALSFITPIYQLTKQF